ncbi:MAG TPA: hypothetical protein VK003_15600 [Oceanobacillus sp.]|nr:hypothetical protein [Oceanobacillus sp.]
MSARAENAIQQLYEDPGLREDLSDDEVPTMLQWAERQVAKLDTESPDDDTFETRFEALRKLLTSINRYIGRRSYSTPEEQTAEMDRIAERAGTLGYTLEEDPMSFEAQGAVDNITAMKALLAKIDGGEDESSTDTPPHTLEEDLMSFEAQSAEDDITEMKALPAKIDDSEDEPTPPPIDLPTIDDFF